MKRFAAILLIALALLSGCGHKITEGEVVSKKHSEASTTLVMMPLTTYNGNKSTTIYIPYYFHYPERWSVTIQGDVDGETKQETFWIDEGTYDDVVIGGVFVYDEDYCIMDEPCTKERQ